MGRQLAEHPCTFASTFESCSFHVKQSKQSARRRIVKTKVAKKTFRATVGPFILAERLRLRMPTAKGRIAVFPRGGLCTFWPQKVPKTPRRMPSPTSSRLTFETGARLKGGFKGRWAAERVISDTTLSLLKPASYAGTFSRAFVSRLRHRAGIFRRLWRREKRRNGWIGNAESCHRRGTRREVVRIIACSGKRTARRRSVKKRGRFARKPAKAPVLA